MDTKTAIRCIESFNKYRRGQINFEEIGHTALQIGEALDSICFQVKYLENIVDKLSDRLSTHDDTNRSLIIDISPRISGKTAKLINNVLDRLVNDKKSIIVCCNNETAKSIMERIRKEIVGRDLFGKFQHNREDTTFEIKTRDTIYVKATTFNPNNLIGIPEREYMFHYDEFDHYINEIEPYFIMQKGYYCTTPKNESMRDYEKCLDNLMKKIGR